MSTGTLKSLRLAFKYNVFLGCFWLQVKHGFCIFKSFKKDNSHNIITSWSLITEQHCDKLTFTYLQSHTDYIHSIFCSLSLCHTFMHINDILKYSICNIFQRDVSLESLISVTGGWKDRISVKVWPAKWETEISQN